MKYILLWLFGLMPALASAQSYFAIYDSLVTERKYETAWNWLNEKDPDNSNPEVFAMKADHLMDYFTVSMMHEMFGLKDLEPGEDLMELRRNMSGTYTMVMFNIEDEADSLLYSHPNNALLHRTKGKFYYDVYMRYGEGLGYSEGALLDHAYNSFKKAAELGDEFAFGYYVMGYVEIISEEPALAKASFLKSIELDAEYPSAHYNLAYLYLMDEEWQPAYEQALISAKQYEDTLYKADAYRLAGVAANGMKKYDLALKNLETSLALIADISTYNHLITAAFGKKDKKLLERYVVAKLELDYTDIQSYEELIDVYTENNVLPDLAKLLQKILAAHKDDTTVQVMLNLALAYTHEDMQKYPEALGYYKTTRKLAVELVGEDHDFVRGMDEAIKEMESKK